MQASLETGKAVSQSAQVLKLIFAMTRSKLLPLAEILLFACFTQWVGVGDSSHELVNELVGAV